MTDATDNQSTIERLRRRSSRTNKWFFFFLFLMPLGVVLPCSTSLALAKWTPAQQGFSPSQGFAIAGLVLPIIGFGGFLLMLGDRAKNSRALAIAEQAVSLGGTFSETAPAEEMNVMKSLRRFSDADYQVGGYCICGSYQGQQFAILDHSAGYRTGQALKLYEQTVVILFGVGRIPDFQVRPRGFLDRVGGFLGDNTVELPSEPRFNKEFTLYGNDPERIREHLGPLFIEWLSKTQATCEVLDGTLVFFNLKRKPAASQWPKLLQSVLECAKALQR